MNRRDLKRLGLPDATQLVAFFGDPLVAGVIGAALGAGILALTAAGVRSFTPETLEVGAMRAVAMVVVGLVVAFGGLLAYYLMVRSGLVAFGLGLAAGFIVPATVMLFRLSGIARPRPERR
jgi:hypothetical protein